MHRREIQSHVIALITVAGLLVFLSPSLRSESRQTGAEAPKVRSEMLVSTSWLADHLADQNLVILHVARERSHYDAGHIPGARYLAFSDLVITREGIANELPPTEQLQAAFTRLGIGDRARIVIYGDNLWLSATRAYFTLDYLGHGDRAALLDGGLEKWKAEKRDLSTAPVNPEAAPFTPKARPQAVVDLRTMIERSKRASDGDGITVIDARPSDQYTGKNGGGHLPGAINLYWMEQLVSREDPVMRPVSELQKIFASAGIKPGDKVITYCNSGVQATHSYFIAKYLGYDVALYDGSFSEWSREPGARVITGEKPR